MAEPIDWRSRITDKTIKSQPADQFLAHPSNPKFHPPEQREALRGAINEVGQVAPVMVSKRSGYTLDGHERIWLAMETNADVDYFEVDVSEEDEAYILATLDPIGMMARHDAAKLDDLLREVNSGEASVQAMLSKLAISSGLVPTDNPYDEWVGMPEFEQETVKCYHSIIVHFNAAEDLADFAHCIEQSVTNKTKYIYHPAQIITPNLHRVIEDES